MDALLISLASFIPMLLMLVVFHELGHFFTAKWFRIKVLEFGVGYPPRAFGIYTGRTRVLLDGNTQYVNVAGAAELRPGQVIKVSSADGPDGNLVARIIEVPQRGFRRKGNQSQKPPEAKGGDELLKHDGKIRAIGSDSMVLADMQYTVNWTPLGGFVRLAGESNPAVPRSLAGKGVLTRAVVLAAGSAMNALLPIVILTGMFMVPQDVPVGDVVVAEAIPDSPAAAAGLRAGDVVVEAGGNRIETQPDLTRAISRNLGSEMDWLIKRGGRQETVKVTPSYNPAAGIVVVTQVAPDSPAAIGGLRAGDMVLEAGGSRIETQADLTRAVTLNAGSEMDWLIDRGGRQETIKVTPRRTPPEGQGPTGVRIELINSHTGILIDLINAHVERRSDPPWVAAPKAVTRTWDILVQLKQEVFSWVVGGHTPQFSGPIGIAQVTGEVTREGGLGGWLVLAVLFSVNLAILNILPIPMLDGGRLLFVLIEWVRRGKRIPPEKEGLVHLIGFVVLIVFVLLISAKDIERLIQGRSFLGG